MKEEPIAIIYTTRDKAVDAKKMVNDANLLISREEWCRDMDIVHLVVSKVTE